MQRVRVIPCLDVRDNRVVKGVRFVDLRDAGDPVDAARAYDQAGADELCFLDITASHEQRSTLLTTVQRTAQACFMPLTVGGGVRSVDDVMQLLHAGADKVTINSAAVARPELLGEAAREVGTQCVVAAIDARLVPNTSPKRWEIFTHGGRARTGVDAIEYARRAQEEGAGEILLTSMDCDGTKDGYDTELIARICAAVDLPVIASGGAGNAQHMIAAAKAGCSAVLAASIFHFGETSIAAVKREMMASGVSTRPPM